MTSSKKTNEDDAGSIFRQAVADASPLPTTDRHHERKKIKPPKPRMTEADNAEVLSQLLDPPPEWLDNFDLSSGEELDYRFNGIQQSTFRKLKRGQFRVESELDLHGYTINTARDALSQFLLQCRNDGLRCVRIIHGKGWGSGNRGPVLKGRVDYWLRQRQEIIAFCSARPQDGGTGALYVLLRNPLKSTNQR